LEHADHYLGALEAACVLADPVARGARIREAVAGAVDQAGEGARITEELLSEVNNLVEWPVPVGCSFDPSFLQVPQEALIASMEDHQKFFPVLNRESGQLCARFIAVANLDSQDVNAVKQGFERVITPRLADARFFWEQDRKRPLDASRAALDQVVFQQKIGSVGDKSNRIAEISRKLAELTEQNPELADRAAQLCKCDLVSLMVGEFPELQGIMGGYYALESGETAEVAGAISAHYSPRFSGDVLPDSLAGQTLALADRLDTLIGVFAAGLKPTGNKDPFALRRAALGLVRLLTESDLDLNLDQLIAIGANALGRYQPVAPETMNEVRSFILDRARQYFRDAGGHDTRRVDAALAAPLTTLLDLKTRIEALGEFIQLPAGEALVAANKRIGNILRKSDSDSLQSIEENRFILPEEKRLFDEVSQLESVLPGHFERGDYRGALNALSGLHEAVDGFFDSVMVMDEDLALRNNRLALLDRLKRMFDRVADLSQAG
jgi:glycyl-tRNA synthetase beta chain